MNAVFPLFLHVKCLRSFSVFASEKASDSWICYCMWTSWIVFHCLTSLKQDAQINAFFRMNANLVFRGGTSLALFLCFLNTVPNIMSRGGSHWDECQLHPDGGTQLLHWFAGWVSQGVCIQTDHIVFFWGWMTSISWERTHLLPRYCLVLCMFPFKGVTMLHRIRARSFSVIFIAPCCYRVRW